MSGEGRGGEMEGWRARRRARTVAYLCSIVFKKQSEVSLL